MDVAAELGDYESRALRPPPDAPGSTRAADLMRRTTIGGVTSTSLLLPAPSCVSFAIDELGGNDLSFQVGVADAQFACNGDVVERVHGKSDGVLFAVEVLCDGVKKRVWQQLVGRDSVGTGLAQASVGLEPWRGKRVELRLVTEPGPSGDAAFDYATWSGLRIYGPTTRKPPTPHLVLIDVDTLRADRVGVCGAKLPTTPRIDAWAKREAAIYRDVLSTASWTLPATASIFTGMYVNQHGVDAFPKSISSETPTLATMLRQEGYETYAIAAGGYVVDALGFSAGFDRFAIDGSKVPNWTAALDWLARRRSEHPAFLFLHTYAVHAPYGHEDRFGDPDHPYTGPLAGKDVDYVNVIDPFNNGNLKLDAQDRAYVERQYSSLVRGVDDVVGSLLERLAAIFGDEDYMVVFTSDHGEEFFEHGRLGHGASIYQELLRVPLLVRYPKSTPNRPLGVFDTPASCVDLVPTVLTALGLPVPAGLPGVPLQADVDDRPPRLHYFTVADRGVTFGGHALLRHLDGDDVSCQLYSLRDDPTEQHDLLAGKEPPPNLRDLRARMEARLDHLLASYPPVKAGTGTRLDAEQLKRLKDLGYTVDGTKESAGSK
jgi:arylsulfatase A-like enzyme